MVKKLIKIYGFAGSGKTTTLINLFKKHPNLKFLYLSFTNATTENLKERIKSIDNVCVDTATIHSLLLSFYQRYLSNGFEFEFNSFVKYCKEKGIPFSVENSNLIGSRAYQKLMGSIYSLSEQNLEDKILKDYFKWKQQKRVIGWEDVLKESLNDFSISSLFRKHYELNQSYYDVLVIDEFQDLSPLEIELIKKIAHTFKFVIVAGDENQSIYSFKSSDPINFINFEIDGFKTEEYVQKHSYRCPSNILGYSLKVLDFVKTKKKRRILPVKKGGSVHMSIGYTLEECYKHIDLLLQYEKGKDIFVLFRTNKLVKNFLRNYGKKYKMCSKFENDKFKRFVGKLGKDEEKDIKILEKLLKLVRDKKTQNQIYNILKNYSVEEVLLLKKKMLDETKNKIYVGTVHSVKGKEKDIVIYLDYLPTIVRESFYKGNSDEEYRIAYVGITRGREKVYIVKHKQFGILPTP